MSKTIASILWRRLDHEGHDACRLLDNGDSWMLAGQASFLEEGGLLCGLAYEIHCGRDWTTRSARVSGFVDKSPLDWRVVRSESGAWTVNGELQPSLDGLIDVDLGFTPATNLVALRRLALGIGASAPTPAAWFPFPELRMARMDQIYRRLAADRYDYTGINYHEVLRVSPVGFVTDYPNLWTAVARSHRWQWLSAILPRRLGRAACSAICSAVISEKLFAMQPIISISNLSKTYANGFDALKNVSLDVRKGEIFALLGPNGAGKTTLINIVCGLVNPGTGSVKVGGYDILADYRKTRSLIGLVPQELSMDAFETVIATVSFSRGLFGKAANPAHIEKVLKSLSLWDKRKDKVMTLSGGMKRRVLIAKALSHEPDILFLDEPTAGVDVELRREMWTMVRALRDTGVTIILTTHYIEEAEEMADRVGVITGGEIILVEDKDVLMRTLGKKQLRIDLREPLAALPASLGVHQLELADGGLTLVSTYDAKADRTGINALLADLAKENIAFRDLETRQSSLEDIFVDLLESRK